MTTTNEQIRRRFEADRVLSDPGASDAATPGFGTWTEVDADRDALVTVGATAETDGTSDGEVVLDVDEDGDGNADYSLTVVVAVSDHSAGVALSDALPTVHLPAGGQYRVRSASDPNGNNTLDDVREVTL